MCKQSYDLLQHVEYRARVNVSWLPAVLVVLALVIFFAFFTVHCYTNAI